MDNLMTYERLIELNISAPQDLVRTPEPEPVTDQLNSVEEYNRVMATNMTVNYSTGLDLIYRARNEGSNSSALDLCSGPGHYSICLSKYLGYKKVVGIDLSQPMVNIANQNAFASSFSKNIEFLVDDVIAPKHICADHSFDLVNFTNSAHHLPSVEHVRLLLERADKLAKPDGLIVMTDLGRLKNKELTEHFVEIAGREFKERNMPNMFRDFYNSMFAAWLPSELKKSIPINSNRTWVQIVPTGLTCFQAILGLPIGRKDVFLRQSYDWLNSGILKSEEAKQDWQMLKRVIDTANYVYK